jgi:predicted aspartyl protease
VIPKGQWQRDLRYREQEIHAITLAPATGTPLVQVSVGGARMALLLDTGTARGFMLTDRAPSVRYHVLEHVVERDASGRPRGQSEAIRVDSLEVLGMTFADVEGTRSDWRMFSSAPFVGTVGLDFFKDRRLTLDYASLTAAVSAAPLPDSLDARHYLVLDLIDPPEGQGHILYVRGVVNGRRAIVHLDTGYSASWVDSAFARWLPRADWPGASYPVRLGAVLDLGGSTFVLDDLREQAIQRGPGLDGPVALSLGSDFLSRFVLTIDLRAKKLVLARTR